jgi:hypothetical protein
MILGMGAIEALTLRQAADRVASAIAFGELAAQHAPEGHPIHAALDDGREAKSWIEDKIPWFENGDSPALPTVSARMQTAIDAIYDAAASIRTSGELPMTVYQKPTTSIPWAWVAAGGVGLVGVFFLFRKRGRR